MIERMRADDEFERGAEIAGETPAINFDIDEVGCIQDLINHANAAIVRGVDALADPILIRSMKESTIDTDNDGITVFGCKDIDCKRACAVGKIDGQLVVLEQSGEAACEEQDIMPYASQLGRIVLASEEDEIW